jgi:hypothetical protein
MRTAYAFCLLLSSLCCFAADKGATADYLALVERARNGDQTVDFRRLRLAYADSDAYDNAPDTQPQKKAMWAALQAKDFHGAIKNADVVLQADYADMDAHFVEFVAYREIKQTDLSDIHNFIFRGLLKSITDSGDGKTPETAFQVIAVHEEYVFLHSRGVGLPKQQSLVQSNGHSFDKIVFDDPDDGKETVLYFNVDIPMKHGL